MRLPWAPVGLCLDVSQSMRPVMAQLDEAVAEFFRALKADPDARLSAEVAMVAFAGNVGRLPPHQFREVSRIEHPPRLSVQLDGKLSPGTNIGGAVNEMLRLLDARKAVYEQKGARDFQPMLVVMTDGKPSTPAYAQAARQAATEVRRREAENRLVVPVAIGSEADLKALGLFTAKRPPGRLREQDFTTFFDWLKESVGVVVNSTSDGRIEFPPSETWREEVVDIPVEAGPQGPPKVRPREGWKVFQYGAHNGTRK